MSNNDTDNALTTTNLRNDDESAATTSTESETFETWTLITEKQKQPKTKPTKTQLTAPSDVEILTATDENINTTVAEIDELSDGISIISESSESIGRISPHPLLRDNVDLTQLLSNSKIYAGLDILDTDEDQSETKSQQIRRRKRSDSTQSAERKALQETTTTTETVPVAEEKCVDLVTRLSEHPLTRRGLSTLFYVGVTLALLGFYGRLRNPDWDLGASKSLLELEQKINDLELQHNLMSAEIDLLNKQVNYLSNLNDKTRAVEGNGKYGKQGAKTFKAWPGNGNNMDAVNIDKADLKRPYKCGEDGKFIEVGGVCVEKPLEENIEGSPVEQEDNIVIDILQESETYKSFEKVAEAFLNKGNEKLNEPLAEPKMPGNYKEYRPTSHESEEKSKKKRHFDDDDDDDDDSKERKKHKNDSKERYNKYKQQSKERYDKKQRKDYDKTKDAYWHEKLMQQREQLRKQRHNHDSNNWYIERGDSREQARSS